jgi:crotonobetainyl-CoA:carnitine CoA-transferase CaiB-like acyl-CoA transferase
MRPLDGITVLDLTRLLPGPAATLLLADFGAEVIQIEEPANPSVKIESLKRGKKTVALNLKDAGGRDEFLRMAESADIVIEGFRPGVMDRLGIGYETLRARNRRLIYVALTGYGQTGPYRGMAGHDVNYLGLAGVLDLIRGADGKPVIPGVQIADLAGGSMLAVIGILLALQARHRTDRGQFVDVSMMDGSAWLLHAALAGMQEPISGKYACYNVYQAKDGRWLAVGALEPKFWATLCACLGCEQLIPDQFAAGPRRLEVIEELQRIFLTKSAGEWFAVLKGYDACVTPVRTVAEAVADEHFRQRPLGRVPILSESDRAEGVATE